jgi:hypothetical protein
MHARPGESQLAEGAFLLLLQICLLLESLSKTQPNPRWETESPTSSGSIHITLTEIPSVRVTRLAEGASLLLYSYTFCTSYMNARLGHTQLAEGASLLLYRYIFCTRYYHFPGHVDRPTSHTEASIVETHKCNDPHVNVF